MSTSRVLCITVWLLLLVSALSAEVPQLVNVQGLLTNPTGEPVTDGTYSAVFAVYETASGGSALWSETRDVATSNGLFAVLLGEMIPIPATVFTSTDLWLGIKVGSDSEMTPRTRLTSVGYAYHALVADSATTSGAGGGGWIDDGLAIRLDAQGDSVGIGTATPAAKLDVRGTVRVGVAGSGQDVNLYSSLADTRLFWDASKGALRAGAENTFYQWTDEHVGAWSFGAGNGPTAEGDASIAMGNYAVALGDIAIALGERARAEGGASVAIGNSSEATGLSAIAVGLGSEASGHTSLALGRYTLAADSGSIALGSGRDQYFTTHNEIPYSLVVGFRGRGPMLFVDSGTVGVGTTDTEEMLHIENDGSGENAFLRIETSHASNWGECGMRFKTPDNTWHLRMDDDSHNNLPAVGSLALRSQNSGNEVMTWTNAGYVGINKTNPSVALDVVGSICYTGSIDACSDARYKRNVETIDGALDKVAQMRGVEFDWRSEEYPENQFSDRRQVGFLAQELVDVLPEVVNQGSDGYYTVDYAKLTPLLVEAIKELNTQNQELQTANRDLLKRLEKLESILGGVQPKADSN